MESNSTLLICECSSTEHQIVINYDKEENQAYCHIHLTNRNFWNRLKNGLKFIFGYNCRFGHWDEFIFKPEHAGKLIELSNLLLPDNPILINKEWLVEDRNVVIIVNRGNEINIINAFDRGELYIDENIFVIDKYGSHEDMEMFRLKLIEQIEKQLACKIESLADNLRTLPVSVPLTENQLTEAIYGNYLMMVQIAKSLSKELPDSYPIFSGHAYDCDGKVIKSEINGTVSDLKNYLRLNKQIEAKIISKHEFVDIDALNKEFS